MDYTELRKLREKDTWTSKGEEETEKNSTGSEKGRWEQRIGGIKEELALQGH